MISVKRFSIDWTIDHTPYYAERRMEEPRKVQINAVVSLDEANGNGILNFVANPEEAADLLAWLTRVLVSRTSQSVEVNNG